MSNRKLLIFARWMPAITVIPTNISFYDCAIISANIPADGCGTSLVFSFMIWFFLMIILLCGVIFGIRMVLKDANSDNSNIKGIIIFAFLGLAIITPFISFRCVNSNSNLPKYHEEALELELEEAAATDEDVLSIEETNDSIDTNTLR